MRKQHEREYFVSQIRAGIVYIVEEEITLKIFNPTIEQQLESSFVFDKVYSEAYRDEVMSQDDMMEWMLEQGVWSEEKDDQIEGLKKDIERCQIEIFNARNNKGQAEHIRKYIRAGEAQLIALLSQQLEYYNNTLEGIATTAKAHWLTTQCTFLDGRPYDFSEMAVNYVYSSYRETLLQGEEIRELARSEPWKSLWMTRKETGCNLFFDTKNRILNDNQKNLVVWPQLYDNIQ